MLLFREAFSDNTEADKYFYINPIKHFNISWAKNGREKMEYLAGFN